VAVPIESRCKVCDSEVVLFVDGGNGAAASFKSWVCAESDIALLSSDELALSEYSQNLSSVLLGAVEANAAALTIDAGLN
jgi:hypothetical protein